MLNINYFYIHKLTVVFLLITLQTFAQNRNTKTDKQAPVNYTFKELQSVKKLLGKIPITRQDMHTSIAGQLKRIDNLDGKSNGKVAGLQCGDAMCKSITNDILLLAPDVANFIENVTWQQEPKADNNTKLVYLKQLRDNLKLFGDASRAATIVIEDYIGFVADIKNIIIAKKENNVKEFVQQNARTSMYLNKALFEGDVESEKILINTICAKNPAFFEYKVMQIAGYENVTYVLTYLAKKDPLNILKYATSTTQIGEVIKQSKDPYIHAIYELGNKMKNSSRALNYLDDYVAGKISFEQIKSITANEEAYYKSLVALKQKNVSNTPALVTRDIKTAVGDYVRIINELHEKSAEVRFKSIDNFDATDLYYLVIYGGDEIYTSSFLGVFNKILKKLNKKSGYEYLEELQMDNFRTYVRMCANYNTLDPFLATMSKEKQTQLMHAFVSGLGDNAIINLDGATEVADAFGSINDIELISSLQSEIDVELDKAKRTNNKDAKNVYYILKSLLSSKMPNANESEFANLMNAELKIPPINYVSFASLIDTVKNSITEQMFFYGDADGKDWYNRFMGSMRASGKWIIEDKNPDWVVFKARNAKVPFNLYANKPLAEPEDEFAQNRLAQYLVENEIAPSVVVHRGHSYHLEHTIESIFELNKIIILGSCGGYHNLGTILGRSPDAHITSSKQVGKGNINSKIIDEVNNIIIKGEDVKWPAIWEKLNKTMPAADRPEWNDYVFPHKNLGALFLKAYKQIESE